MAMGAHIMLREMGSRLELSHFVAACAACAMRCTGDLDARLSACAEAMADKMA